MRRVRQLVRGALRLAELVQRDERAPPRERGLEAKIKMRLYELRALDARARNRK